MDVPNVIYQSASEKLVFHPLYTISEIPEILKHCKNLPLNVEFHSMEFDNSSSVLWQERGEFIHSLEFIDCTFNIEVITSIFNCCKNLIHVGWQYSTSQMHQNKSCFFDLLEKLEKKIAKENSVKSVKLHLDSIEWISKTTLPSLLSLFPNVQELTFYIASSEMNIHSMSDSQPEIFTSYKILDMLISSKEIISCIQFKLPNKQLYQGFTCRTSEPLLKYLRSKNVELDTRVNNNDLNQLIKFCAELENLESVECDLSLEIDEDSNMKEIFAKQFLSGVLKKCPNLQHLRLNIDPNYHEISIDQELFVIMLDSKLKSLDITCDKVTFQDISTKKNDTLRSLTLKISNQEALLGFIKSFIKLDHLSVYGAEDEVMQSIWKFQPQLISLKLLSLVPYTEGFIGVSESGDVTENSISKLENLQMLHIFGIEPDWNATDDIFDHFTFPKLFYLRLDIMDSSGVTTYMLNAIGKNMPNVEVLILHYYNEVIYKLWFKLCKTMKKLRYLLISGSDVIEDGLTDQEYKKLFTVCPTLRLLKHEYKDQHKVTYYYNIVQKKVIKKTSPYVSVEEVKIAHSKMSDIFI